MGFMIRRLLNQSTNSRVAYSTASKDRQGLRLWISPGLVKAVDGFGQGVVVTVAGAAYGVPDADPGKALGLFLSIRIAHHNPSDSPTRHPTRGTAQNR